MSSDVLSLLTKLTMNTTSFVSGINDATRRVREFASDTARAVADGAAKIAAGATAMSTGITVALGGAAKGAAEVQERLSKIETLLSRDNQNAPFLEGIKRGAFDIAKKYGKEVEDVLDSIYNALQAQVPEENVLQIVEDAAKGATGNLASMDDTLSFLKTNINGYAMEWDKTNRIMDLAFKTIDIGDTSIVELGTQMSRVTSLAYEHGVSVEELYAGYAMLTAAGHSTAVATTGLVSVIQKMAKPTKTAQEMADRLGLNWDAAALKANGLDGQMQQLRQALERHPEISWPEAAGALFDRVTGKVAMLIMNNAELEKQGKGWNDVLAVMKTRTDAAGDAAVIMLAKNPKLTWQNLKTAMREVADTIGTAVLTSLRDLTIWLVRTVGNIGSWMAKNPTFVAGLVSVAMGVAVVTAGIAAFATGLMVAALLIASIATVGLPAILAFTTVLLPVFGTLAIAGAALIANWDAIKAWVTGNWQGIKDSILWALEPLVDAFYQVSGSVKAAFQTAGQNALSWVQTNWPLIVKTIRAGASWIAYEALPAISEAVRWVLQKFQDVVSWIAANWPSIVSVIGSVASWITGTAFPAVGAVLIWLWNKFIGFVDWVRTSWPTIKVYIGMFTDWLTQTAFPAVGEAVRWVVGILKEMYLWVQRHWPELKQVASNLWSAFVAWLKLAWDAVKRLWTVLKELFLVAGGDNAQSVLGGLAKWFSVVEGVANTLRIAFSLLGSAIQVAFDALKAFLDLSATAKLSTIVGGGAGIGVNIGSGLLGSSAASLGSAVGSGASAAGAVGALGAGSTATAGGGGATQYINIGPITQNAGESAEALADRVAEAVMRRRGRF